MTASNGILCNSVRFNLINVSSKQIDGYVLSILHKLFITSAHRDDITLRLLVVLLFDLWNNVPLRHIIAAINNKSMFYKK